MCFFGNRFVTDFFIVMAEKKTLKERNERQIQQNQDVG